MWHMDMIFKSLNSKYVVAKFQTGMNTLGLKKKKKKKKKGTKKCI